MLVDDTSLHVASHGMAGYNSQKTISTNPTWSKKWSNWTAAWLSSPIHLQPSVFCSLTFPLSHLLLQVSLPHTKLSKTNKLLFFWQSCQADFQEGVMNWAVCFNVHFKHGFLPIGCFYRVDKQKKNKKQEDFNASVRKRCTVFGFLCFTSWCDQWCVTWCLLCFMGQQRLKKKQMIQHFLQGFSRGLSGFSKNFKQNIIIVSRYSM